MQTVWVSPTVRTRYSERLSPSDPWAACCVSLFLSNLKPILNNLGRKKYYWRRLVSARDLWTFHLQVGGLNSQEYPPNHIKSSQGLQKARPTQPTLPTNMDMPGYPRPSPTQSPEPGCCYHDTSQNRPHTIIGFTSFQFKVWLVGPKSHACVLTRGMPGK